MSTETVLTTEWPIRHRRWVQLAALAALVCLGVALRVVNLNGVTRRTPDEYAYAEAGKVLVAQGRAGVPVLMEHVAANPMTAANPVRAGYLFLVADAMRLTGHTDEFAGAELACAASIVCVLLLAVVAWRRFSPGVALVAMLLYAVNPAALMTARRGWGDTVIEAVALLMLLAACEVAAGSRPMGWGILVALTGGFAITLKQTAVLSFAFCAGWILVVLWLRRQRRDAALFAGLCTLTVLVAVAWLAHLLGGWQHFVAFLTNSMNSSTGNAYSMAYEGGSPLRLGRAFPVVSAPTVMLVLAAIGYARDLSRPVPVERQMTWAFFGLCVVFLATVTLMNNRMNLRYLAPLYAPEALLAGVGMAFLVDMATQRRPAWGAPVAGVAGMLVLGAAALDYTHFRTEFALPDVQDLSVRMVVEAAGSPTPVALDASGAAVPPGGVEFWIAAAVKASQAGECQATIDASTHAVQIDANSALAWNNLAAGFECSHQWPAAISAAQHALQIQPDFPLARNNLNWSLEQQAKESSK
jgi:4-amino-4-deoxy-L-arabinose transferase-like glycosyltransferase